MKIWGSAKIDRICELFAPPRPVRGWLSGLSCLHWIAGDKRGADLPFSVCSFLTNSQLLAANDSKSFLWKSQTITMFHSMLFNPLSAWQAVIMYRQRVWVVLYWGEHEIYIAAQDVRAPEQSLLTWEMYLSNAWKMNNWYLPTSVCIESKHSSLPS